MHSFLFGDSKQPLYGVHHSPAAAVFQDNAVLICNPLGQDYYRCHTLLRNLATNLAANGHHVLRFDYRGTGDSFGELRDFGIEHWLDDIRMAISELQAISGSNNIIVIGVRMGGYLSMQPSLQGLFRRLILWDGVIETTKYLRELLSMNLQLLNNRSWFKFPRNSQEQQENELVGFHYSEAYINALRSTAVSARAVDGNMAISAVFSADSPQKEVTNATLKPGCDHYQSKDVTEKACWNDIDRLGNLLACLEIIKTIAAEVSR